MSASGRGSDHSTSNTVAKWNRYESVRIGLIGAVGMGSFHARTLANMPGVAISVVADPVGDAAETLAAELDAVFESLESGETAAVSLPDRPGTYA